jgi:S1-C subfamily serine protease
LIAVERIEIREVKEIHHALAEKGWGKDITLTIIREGMKKEITVTLPSVEE